MQSSPPQRAWERPSPRGGQSAYSLDLGALDDTDSDIELPKQKVERIFSEDIDGPSDFTQNLDSYMRGGTISKGIMKGMKRPTIAIEEDEEHEEHEAEQLDLLEAPKNAAEGESDHTGSHHTPENTPPKVSVLDHDAQDPYSSEWHTNGSSSTPVPPVHKQFLQPTVEDYYSELSPARQSSAQAMRGRPFESSALKPKQSPIHQEEESTPGRASSPTLSPVRSPIIMRTTPKDNAYEVEERDELRAQLRQLQAKCQQLEHLNQALNQAVDEERRLRKQEKAVHDASAAEAARREQDLVEMKDAAHRDNDEFQRDFGALKGKLREQEMQAVAARLGDEDSSQHLRAELQRVREHMEMLKVEHKQEVRALQQDLALARRGRDDAEEALKDRGDELDEQQEMHEAEMGRIRAELQQMQVDDTAIAELERQLEDANAQIKQLEDDHKEASSSATTYRDQLAKVKQNNETELSRATSDRGRAVDLASNLQRQLQEVRQQLKEEQTAHTEETERLKSQQKQSVGTSDQELEVIRAELEAKQTELNEAILERDEAQDTLQSRQSEEEALQNEIADMKAVNAEIDTQLSEKLQRRENHWKNKLEEADKERQLMAKALLHQWGREEVGISSPQMYAYKYLKKSSGGGGGSPVKSPTKARATA